MCWKHFRQKRQKKLCNSLEQVLDTKTHSLRVTNDWQMCFVSYQFDIRSGCTEDEDTSLIFCKRFFSDKHSWSGSRATHTIHSAPNYNHFLLPSSVKKKKKKKNLALRLKLKSTKFVSDSKINLKGWFIYLDSKWGCIYEESSLIMLPSSTNVQTVWKQTHWFCWKKSLGQLCVVND